MTLCETCQSNNLGFFSINCVRSVILFLFLLILELRTAILLKIFFQAVKFLAL